MAPGQSCSTPEGSQERKLSNRVTKQRSSS